MMKQTIDDDMKEFKEFIPNPIKDKLILIGIILFGVFAFFTTIYSAAVLSNKAVAAVTQGLNLPPPNTTIKDK